MINKKLLKNLKNYQTLEKNSLKNMKVYYKQRNIQVLILLLLHLFQHNFICKLIVICKEFIRHKRHIPLSCN